MFPPLLILCFVMAFASFFARHFKLKLKMSNIPGPRGYPLVGNAPQIIRYGRDGVLKVLDEFTSQYGSRFQMWLASSPYVVVSNSKDIEKILTSQQHIEKSSDYDFLMPWLGRGLLTSTGSLWHSRRKLLTPAFHFAILEDFLTIMCEQGDILTRILMDMKGKEFNIFPYVTRAALDIICETAMGKKIHVQEQSDSEYVRAVYRMSDLVQYRQLRPWFHPDFIWYMSPSGKEESKLLKILHDFTTNVIKKRKKQRKEGGSRRGRKPAFLDLLLDYQASKPEELDDTGIREEVDTFMFEGHDTTAANLNWTIYCIGSHPEVQAKVHEEIDRVLSQKEGKISSSDLSKMKYLENCIKESLRLYPSVPMIGRRLAGDLKLDEETTLPQEATVMIIMYAAHRDPTVFKDPEQFRPERFEDGEKNPFGFVPFSAGPRNCIGQKFAMMEEKIVLAKLFQKFKVTSLEKKEDITLLAELILRPKEGIKVRLESRE